MLATLIASVASGEAMLALRRAKIAALVYAIVGLLALAGLIFLLLGAYLWTAAHYGPIDAAAAFGGGFLAAALLIFVVFKLTSRVRRRRASARRKGELTTIAVTTALALLPALASRKPALPLLLAPLLGAVGYRIYKENKRRKSGSEDAEPL